MNKVDKLKKKFQKAILEKITRFLIENIVKKLKIKYQMQIQDEHLVKNLEKKCLIQEKELKRQKNINLK